MTSPGPAAPTSTGSPRKRSLIDLITSIPTLVTDLVQREIELVKAEMTAKLKALGIGAGIIAGAVLVLLAMLGVLLTAGILALSLVMPGWLAALLVAAGLLIIAVILGLIGYSILKKGIPPVPTESIDSLKHDLRAIKGIGKREPMSTPSTAKAQAQKARDELANALDAIEDKLNVPKRAQDLGKQAVAAYEKNPLPFIIGGVAVAVVAVGLIAWAIFSDDD